MTAVPVGFSLEASSGSMVHTSSLFTVLDMYRRQLYVGWSISARTGIEIESGTGVCGRESLCTTQGTEDPVQLRMNIEPGPCSRGTLTGDSRTSIFIEEKRSGGDVGSSVRALGSRYTFRRSFGSTRHYTQWTFIAASRPRARL